MRVLLLAPPGGGKGTQGARIAERYGAEHLATGDILRAEVAAGTQLGRHVSDVLARGDLVSDSIIMALVRERVIRASKAGGYVLDGFPRTVDQAVSAYALHADVDISLQAVINLDVPAEAVLERMRARAAVQGRADDTEDVMRHRLEVYAEKTRPLLDYYARRGLLVSVDAAGPIDELTASVFRVLDPIAEPELVH
ncbi:MAG TPA: adenylate kinase [Mycobacteriales bacterium]|nr:adenylate kinase [Mycobacteriales bacterium]